MARNLLRFKDLKDRRIVNNWAQLGNLVEKYGFPAGFMPSPNTRAWFEDEVDAWLDAKASTPARPQLKGAAKQLHEAKGAA